MGVHKKADNGDGARTSRTLAGGMFWVVVPIVMLIAGVYVASAYVSVTADVNRAGQLRYRTLLMRELMVRGEPAKAHLERDHLELIHKALEARYSKLPYFQDPSFANVLTFVERGEIPPFDNALRHVESADRLTTALASSALGLLKTTVALIFASMSLLVLTITRLVAANRKLTKAEAELVRLASTDALTLVGNRRKLLEVMETIKLESTGLRLECACVLVLVDIDHFKVINDAFGHPQGDCVLVAFAALLVEGGLGDVFRYGGEEFAIVLRDHSLEEATAVTERLRANVSGRELATVAVTASFGVAGMHANDTSLSVLARADRALYTAKRLGRNRVATEKQAAKSIVPHKD
jgi:diguanylate cyclase (GGDEF)-like protein